MYIDKEGYLNDPDQDYITEYTPTSKCDHNDGISCTNCLQKVSCTTKKYKVNKDGLFEEVKVAGND